MEELNRVVPEAFLHFFIKTVGHFPPHVLRKAGEPGVFQARKFYKELESKNTRHFVKKFIQTQMFDLFIQEIEQQPASQEGMPTCFPGNQYSLYALKISLTHYVRMCSIQSAWYDLALCVFRLESVSGWNCLWLTERSLSPLQGFSRRRLLSIMQQRRWRS